MKNTVDYSVIIPAFNEEQDLPVCLKALCESMKSFRRLHGEIIVTDNNSTDRTAEIAQESGAKVVFEAHRQIARSRNTGAAAAEGRFLIFLDADTIVTAEILRNALSVLESGRFCGGGALVKFDQELPFFVRVVARFMDGLILLMPFAPGAFIFCTKEAFEAAGRFDENFYASEEIHLSKKLCAFGRKNGQGFYIIKKRIMTSARKIRWYSLSGLVRFTLKLLFSPSSLKDRERCWMWYNRP